MDPFTVVDKIIEANLWLANFWSHSHGWAPNRAADLMSASRLDRQVSLSRTLKLWVRDENNELSDGELILAWANLGTLIEGTLKLFCSIFYEDYRKDIRAPKNKRDEIKEPDIIRLEDLKVICYKSAGIEKEWYDFIDLVQHKRNAIHAYQDKDIGDTKEFYKCLEKYLYFIERIQCRIPYPDEVYVPNFVEKP
jgi:hypothetical protein